MKKLLYILLIVLLSGCSTFRPYVLTYEKGKQGYWCDSIYEWNTYLILRGDTLYQVTAGGPVSKRTLAAEYSEAYWDMK